MLRIHFTTFIVLILSYVFNYHIEYLIFFLLVLLHELGHLIMIKLHRLKFKSLTIMPFGCLLDYESKKKEGLLISISGILVNLILYNLDFYPTYNMMIILINVIPVYPLDGYLILRSLRLNKKILLQISSTMLVGLVIVSIYYQTLLVGIIAIYLIYRNIELYQKKDLLRLNEIHKEYSTNSK